MQRAQKVVFALVAAFLLVTAMPVQAADAKLVVGSQHDSDTELSAGTLTDMTVEGSGDAAEVVLNQDTFTDGFEDEAADSGTPDNWEIAQSGFNSQNVTTVRSSEGAQSYAADGPGTGVAEIRPSEQPYGSALTENVSVDIYAETGSMQATVRLFEGGTRIFVVGIRDGDLAYYDGSNWQTLSTAVDSGEWVAVTISQIDPGSDTVAVEWSSPSDSGSSAGISTETAMSNGYDETRLSTADDVAFYDAFAVGSPADSGEYISANHSVENAEEAAFNVTQATNVSATLRADYWDGSSWVKANETTISTAANHTLQLPDVSADTWRVNVSVSKTDVDPAFRFGDDSILFTDHSPGVNNSSADPQGNSLVNKNTVTLSIPVNDTEFGTTQGDSVDVEFYVDGSLEETKTITSNQTVSVDVSGLNGGSHNWSVTATDSHGLSTTSNTFEFKTPSVIEVRDEQNPDQLVNSTGSATGRFYSSDGETVIERPVDNGTIDLAGLPTNEEFVVSVEVDGWHFRTIIIDSILQQDEIFLLNKTNATTVDVKFELNDRTGDFPESESKLYIERALNRSGTTEWVTISGDYFGADKSFRTTLEKDYRYRLTIENSDGDTRVLGTYTATQSETATLTIGRIEWDIEESDDYIFRTNYQSKGSGDYIYVEFNDPNDKTADFNWTIYEQGNQSNVLASDSASGPLGTYSHNVSLTANQSEKTWVIDWNGTRNGERIGATYTIGGHALEIPMDGRWLGSIVMVFLVFVASLHSGRLSSYGATVVVGFAGVFMVFQMIDIPIAMWWAAAAIAGFGHIRSVAGGTA